MECSFDERREYAARAVIRYLPGRRERPPLRSGEDTRGLDAALGKSKIGPKEGIPDRRGGR